jgi:hypothetical protein
MGRAEAFEWEEHASRGVYFLFMFTTLPFACVYSYSPAGASDRKPKMYMNFAQVLSVEHLDD